MMIAPDALASSTSLSVIGADAAVHDLDLHLGGRELRQRVGQRFGRAALVGLDDDA